MKEITLEIPKEITYLAGNELGRNICCSQVDPYLDKNDKEVIIEIPDHIENVAIGFIQGMKAILELGRENIEVKFKAKDRKLEEKIVKDYNY